MTTQRRETVADLLSVETAGEYLVERKLLPPPAEAVVIQPLGGGVSNIVLAARQGSAHVVLKQALPQLRVADEWFAKRERAINEAQALILVSRLTPEAVPTVLDVDSSACALTIAAAPESWSNWKEQLLAGNADPLVARRLGVLLATWHGATSEDEAVAGTFDDHGAFDQLRVDPYYRTVMRRRPEVRGAIRQFVQRMAGTHACLVHGDFSPKNVLVGDGVWVLDFEVAHYGDPAFDVAFMLNHLLLKRLHEPGLAKDLERCAVEFWGAYLTAIPEALFPGAPYVLGHVGCLMLARVDGKSPAEYLTGAEREAARRIGVRLVCDPPKTLAEALDVSDPRSPT